MSVLLLPWIMCTSVCAEMFFFWPSYHISKHTPLFVGLLTTKSWTKSSAGRYTILSSAWPVLGSNTFQTSFMYQWQVLSPAVHAVNDSPLAWPLTIEASFNMWSFGILISPISTLVSPIYCQNVYFLASSSAALYV